MAAATLPSAAPNPRHLPMQVGTNGYGMVFSTQAGPACRLDMVFNGPALVQHLAYLQDNNMVSKSLTPAAVAQEPDVLAFSLGQRAAAVALPGLVSDPGTRACDVAFKVIHTPLSPGGLHTLLHFKISRAQASTFRDHVPGLSEIRTKSLLFDMADQDIAGVALEADHASIAQSVN